MELNRSRGGRRVLAATYGLELSVDFFKGIDLHSSQNAAKLFCSIFKQTTQEKKRSSDPGSRGAALTPPPGEDRVQNLGNPERAEGALAAAT